MDQARRTFILGASALLLGSQASAATPALNRPRSLAAPSVHTRPAADVRRVSLLNLHTGDRLSEVYWENGAYVEEVLNRARYVMRDWRNDQQHIMDNGLFDIFHELARAMETQESFQLISGFRSPGTNAALHAQSAGVAKHSLHMLGKAADIRVEGVQLSDLRRAAASLSRGGVGYYPQSNFVHVDTGRVRQWAGS